MNDIYAGCLIKIGHLFRDLFLRQSVERLHDPYHFTNMDSTCSVVASLRSFTSRAFLQPRQPAQNRLAQTHRVAVAHMVDPALEAGLHSGKRDFTGVVSGNEAFEPALEMDALAALETAP